MRNNNIKIALCAFNEEDLGIRQISSYLKIKGFTVEFVALSEENINYSKFTDFDIIGLSFITDNFVKAKNFSNKIKYERKQHIKPIIIFGGVHATIRPRECLDYCDYVVRGEGEEAMLEICSDIAHIESKHNISLLKNGVLINNPLKKLETNLDKYPFPDFSAYSSNLKKYNIMTSRGCPFNCTYCYNNYLRKLYVGENKFVRKKSMSYILEELKLAKMKFKKLKEIRFYDDNLLMRDVKELRAFFKEYKKHINLPFYCLGNPNDINEEKLRILKDAGLNIMQIGMQTGSEEVNFTIYKRPTPNKKILECLRLFRKYEITNYLDLIFNNPYETKEDLRKTLTFLLTLPKTFKLNGYNLIFYPGTEITDKALHDGHISPLIDETSSKIQGDANSPTTSFDNTLDNPLWKINFSSEDKDKLNTLIVAINYLPAFLVRSLVVLPLNKRFIVLFIRLFTKIKSTLRTKKADNVQRVGQRGVKSTFGV